MRVIGGKIKGRRLETYWGRFLRPTSGKIREAIFNIITPLLNEGSVLDLFAGTGSFGIEALSRGMDRAVFIEDNPRILSLLKKNISNCQLENQTEVIGLRVARGLKILKFREEKFKLIFLDPPYQGNLAGTTLLEISEAKVLTKDGLVIVEHSAKGNLDSIYGDLRLDDQRKYGQALVSFFTLCESP